MKTKINAFLRTYLAALCLAGLQAAAQSQPTWQTVTIPGLATGSQLGSVWARTRTEAYVWAIQNLGGTNNAQLYRWDGAQWYKVLDAPSHGGDYSVHGVGSAEVFASAATDIWRSTNSGQTWALQSLPPVNGYLRKLSGTANNIHVNTQGGQIIRFDGTAWSISFSDAVDYPYTLDVSAATEGYYVTCWGWGRWNGSQWSFTGRQFDFCDVYDTWWMRDGAGNLHWYAVGNNNFSNGIRIWRFDTNTMSFVCKVCYVFSDGSAQNTGSAVAVWGSAPDDVYLGGGLATSSGGHRTGRLYHYDGANWSQVTAIGAVAEVAPYGIAGSARDDVWVSLSTDGRLLHYAPPPPSVAIQMYAGLTISGQIGATYQIQYSPKLNSPTNWATLTNLTLPSSPYLFFDAASASRPVSFYRAVLAP